MKQRARVQGRPYKSLKDVACGECRRNVRALTPLGLFLHKCSYSCGELVCKACLENHEAMHELARAMPKQDEEEAITDAYFDKVFRGI
jgi:hypothetical protein